MPSLCVGECPPSVLLNARPLCYECPPFVLVNALVLVHALSVCWRMPSLCVGECPPSVLVNALPLELVNALPLELVNALPLAQERDPGAVAAEDPRGPRHAL